MKKLDIETKNGNIPIDQKIVNKYNLEKGTKSPFTGNRIVGINGEYPLEKPKENDVSKLDPDNGDGIAEMDGGLMLSTSEIIDFSEATDSTNG